MKLYNSLSNKKEPLFGNHLLNEKENESNKEITFYSCGQTVYLDVHIGNARTYTYWDILVRWLRYSGYKVNHVQNFTDVGHLTDDADLGDDKIENEALKRKISPYELIEKQIENYWKDMDKLNILRPNISPRATGHILEMIEHIKLLIDKKYAYIVNGSVYFDVKSFPNYGQLSPTFTYLKEDESPSVHRLAVKSEKKSPQDFALWINAENTDHIMRWPSPWSKGYPGWHIECSVMAKKYLGDTIDIHAGGIEHRALHHPNEIAQSESVSGKKMARFWIHAAHLKLNGKKMSKSKGNTHSLHEILEKYPTPVLRLFYASSQYRKSTDFTFKLLDDAKETLNKILTNIRKNQEISDGDDISLEEDLQNFRLSFAKAMNDDLNTPLAIKEILKFIKILNINKNSSKELIDNSIQVIKDYLLVLGINVEQILKQEPINSENISEKLLVLLIDVRNNLREEKNYKLADSIRSKLNSFGYNLEDNSNKNQKTELIKGI